MTSDAQTFRRACWAGAATLVLAVGLLLLFPATMGPLPAGMKTPILAFELARSSQEVEQMFGAVGSSERAAWASAMQRGNLVDFVFMACYGAYLWLFSRALAHAHQSSSPRPRAGFDSSLARLAGWLAPLPPLMDVLENVQLSTITERLGGDYASALGRLGWFTWLKWLPLVLVLALWSAGLWRLGRLGRTSAVVCLSSVVLAVFSLFLRGLSAELMALAVSVSLLCTFVLAVRAARAPAQARRWSE